MEKRVEKRGCRDRKISYSGTATCAQQIIDPWRTRAHAESALTTTPLCRHTRAPMAVTALLSIGIVPCFAIGLCLWVTSPRQHPPAPTRTPPFTPLPHQLNCVFGCICFLSKKKTTPDQMQRVHHRTGRGITVFFFSSFSCCGCLQFFFFLLSSSQRGKRARSFAVQGKEATPKQQRGEWLLGSDKQDKSAPCDCLLCLLFLSADIVKKKQHKNKCLFFLDRDCIFPVQKMFKKETSPMVGGPHM